MRNRQLTEMAENFHLSDDMIAYYARYFPNGMARSDATFEFEKFKAYHEMKGSQFKNWDAAWRTWVLHAKEFSRQREASAAPEWDENDPALFGDAPLRRRPAAR